MSSGKLCLSCKWFCIKIEGHRWSDITPGSTAYVGCTISLNSEKDWVDDRKDHWGFDPGDPNDIGRTTDEEFATTDVTEYYRKMLHTAENCGDYAAVTPKV